jgi:dTDP-4-amino-4,6-dideoxygalactose transaminase
MLVFGQPAVGEEEIAAVVETMRSKWMGTGPCVKRFQEEFCAYAGGRYGAATNSCTAALHICMVAAGVGPGDEVVTTPMTFCATANAIMHTGARPVFADCDPRTGNILPAEIVKKITPRTRAIIPVHFAGRPCDMTAILAIAKEHKLLVFEDCAHAIEAKIGDRHCGTFGEAGCFSFYVTKNITTVEGGMVVTDDEAFASKVRILSLHGMSKDAWKRFSDEGYVHYSVSECGYKYNLTDMAAALGLCQLAKIESFYRRRREIWDRYMRELAGLPLLLPPPAEPGTTHALHLFTPLLDTARTRLTRDRVLQELQARNIGTGVHYIALNHHALYQGLGYKDGEFPGAEFISDRTFSIPLSPALKDDDVTDVIEALRDVLV